MQKKLLFKERPVGDGHPCYIIAEAGVNHNGDLAMALQLVRAAKDVGADCVKFQTFKAERVAINAAPKAAYQLDNTDQQETQLDMLRRLELKPEYYREIIDLCAELGIDFMSSPFSNIDADFLHKELDIPVFKIGSTSTVEPDLLRHVAQFGKPIILSTGMANLAEVYDAVSAIRKDGGNEQLVVLQCTTNYPSRLEDANIRSMVSMRQSLDVLVGYSDHVASNFACYTAVALGACVVEKHFTLDNALPGPDHVCSLNPDDFRVLVQGIRDIEKSLGSPVKAPTARELENLANVRRSVVPLVNLPAGTVIEKKHVGFKRPASGLAPNMLDKILGKKTTAAIKADVPLQMADICW